MELDRLLDPVEGDSPSGMELRNDARFHAIERLLEPAGKVNRLNPDGSVNESAGEAEWQQILDASMELAADGRDLRLLMQIVRASARLDGFAGLARSLGMLTETLDRYWDSLHPEMRDRPDPAMAVLPRTNALKQIENDDNGLLGDLKYSALFRMPGVGAIWGQDLAAASMTEFEVRNNAPSGLSKAEQDAIVSQHGQVTNRVTAACRALAAERADEARSLVEGIDASKAALEALVVKFREKAGFADGMGLSLPETTEFLDQCRKSLQAAMAEMGAGGAEAVPGADGAAAPAGMPQPAGPAGAPAVAVAAPGTISSRADVEVAIDRIVEFYARAEPSSPIPYLLERIKRMVPMDFMELMQEVAPGGVKDFNSLAGIAEDKKRPAREPKE